MAISSLFTFDYLQYLNLYRFAYDTRETLYPSLPRILKIVTWADFHWPNAHLCVTTNLRDTVRHSVTRSHAGLVCVWASNEAASTCQTKTNPEPECKTNQNNMIMDTSIRVALLWGTLTWHSCATLLIDTFLGHLVRHFSKTPLWDSGTLFKTLLCDTLVNTLLGHSGSREVSKSKTSASYETSSTVKCEVSRTHHAAHQSHSKHCHASIHSICDGIWLPTLPVSTPHV